MVGRTRFCTVVFLAVVFLSGIPVAKSIAAQSSILVEAMEGELYRGEAKVRTGSTQMDGEFILKPRLASKSQKAWVIFSHGTTLGAFPKGAQQGSQRVKILWETNGRIARLEFSKMQSKNPIIDLHSGSLFVHSGKLGRNFKYRTKSLAADRVGTPQEKTSFLLQVMEDETYLCVSDGSVLVTKANQSREVKKGYDLWAYPGKNLKIPRLASQDMWKMASGGFKRMGF